MDEGTDIPETIQLKTMTPEQERYLGQMLRGLMGSIGGLELGTPYGGALESSYSPYTPEYGPTKWEDGGGGGDGGDVITKKQLQDPSKQGDVIRKEQLTAPSGSATGTVAEQKPTEGKTVLGEILDIVQRRQEPTGMIQPGTPQIPPTGMPPTEISTAQPGLPPAGDEQTMMMRMLESILSPSPMPISPVNVPPAGDVLPPEAQPVSPISQLLTQPFVQPFREGMTGNYPGPIRRR